MSVIILHTHKNNRDRAIVTFTRIKFQARKLMLNIDNGPENPDARHVSTNGTREVYLHRVVPPPPPPPPLQIT